MLEVSYVLFGLSIGVLALVIVWASLFGPSKDDRRKDREWVREAKELIREIEEEKRNKP